MKKLTQLKRMGRVPSASAIRAVWNYRRCGLTVDQAREYIDLHRQRRYGRNERKRRGARQNGGGRILSMLRRKREAEKHRDNLISSISYLSAGEKISWRHPKRLIRVVLPDGAERIIYCVRREDARWAESGKKHYPLSTSTWGEAYLISDGEISVNDALHHNRLEAISERWMRHDFRGKWADRIVDELLPGGVVDYQRAPSASPPRGVIHELGFVSPPARVYKP